MEYTKKALFSLCRDNCLFKVTNSYYCNLGRSDKDISDLVGDIQCLQSYCNMINDGKEFNRTNLKYLYRVISLIDRYNAVLYNHAEKWECNIYVQFGLEQIPYAKKELSNKIMEMETEIPGFTKPNTSNTTTKPEKSIKIAPKKGTVAKTSNNATKKENQKLQEMSIPETSIKITPSKENQKLQEEITTMQKKLNSLEESLAVVEEKIDKLSKENVILHEQNIDLQNKMYKIISITN